MIDRKEALTDLLEKVEAGNDVTARDASRIWPNGYAHVVNASLGSLDAAKALHEAVLPGWFAGVSENIYGHGWHGWAQTHERSMDALSDDPALAWLIAIIKALIAQEPDQ